MHRREHWYENEMLFAQYHFTSIRIKGAVSQDSVSTETIDI
jgi:hypothetical protein